MAIKPVRVQKRPVTVHALRWDGSSSAATEIIDWVIKEGGNATLVCIDPDDCLAENGDSPHKLRIITLEGPMDAFPGWWIIRGLEGEFYPCKGSVFNKSYDVLDFIEE